MYNSKLLNRLIATSFVVIMAIVANSCQDDDNSTKPANTELSFKIAVFSDPHYFDPNLGLPGQAFFDAKVNSRKMIALSEPILNSAIDMILNNPSDIVLIPGDLTKDGEKSSHLKFATILARLKTAGKKVFVVPGNHDVLNPEAYSYSGDDKFKTDYITTYEFQEIYSDYGYSDAIYKDSNSLTYIAEPIPGLWIVAMDACRYKENSDRHVVGGRFNPQTYQWIKDKLKIGKNSGKLMLGVLHHGILEHFQGQKENPISSDFVIDDYQTVSKEFSDLGMNFVFTGHFHASDVVSAKYDNSFLYDIETGSLLTYPVSLRFVNVDKSQTMEVSTAHIENVNYYTKGMQFQQYAKNYLTEDLDVFVADMLVSQFSIDKQIADEISPVGVDAFLSHYKGDEIISKDAVDLIDKYSTSSNFAIRLILASIESLYTDINPQDNNVKINMKTGAIIP